jgi:hypothetical protein
LRSPVRIHAYRKSTVKSWNQSCTQAVDTAVYGCRGTCPDRSSRRNMPNGYQTQRITVMEPWIFTDGECHVDDPVMFKPRMDEEDYDE